MNVKWENADTVIKWNRREKKWSEMKWRKKWYREKYLVAVVT